MIEYKSTRGAARKIGFADTLLSGLAPDGGLYVPDQWPVLQPSISPDQPYAAFAAEVMWPFVEGSIEPDAFEAIAASAYSVFESPEVIPVVELDDGIELAELFWGPTLAFKDVAMQLLGGLFDYELDRRGERVTIVAATSGDTGSAAIEAFRDRANVDIVVLHPHGRTSDVQRRQMTTVDAPNVHNIAIQGTFDDCQDLLKAMFANESFRDEVSLGAVNSINWARVMAQTVYYHWALRGLRPGELASVAVPTGNFGNIFAGRVAKRMGAPIGEFVVASNRNAILTEFFGRGTMTVGSVEPSLSPSMDIAVSSNLERLIFELLDNDGAAVAESLIKFRSTGRLELPPDAFASIRGVWHGERVTDRETTAVMREVYEESGMFIDPHTAVGVGAARRRGSDMRRFVLATAHPAKFPDAVEQATGIRPELPGRLSDLFERPERYSVLANEVEVVEDFVRSARRS